MNSKMKEFIEKNWIIILLIQLIFNLLYLTFRNEPGTYTTIGKNGNNLLNTKTGDTYRADSNDYWQLDNSFQNGVVRHEKKIVITNDTTTVDYAAPADTLAPQ